MKPPWAHTGTVAGPWDDYDDAESYRNQHIPEGTLIDPLRVEWTNDFEVTSAGYEITSPTELLELIEEARES